MAGLEPAIPRSEGLIHYSRPNGHMASRLQSVSQAHCGTMEYVEQNPWTLLQRISGENSDDDIALWVKAH